MNIQGKGIQISIFNNIGSYYGVTIDEGDKVQIIIEGTLEDQKFIAVVIHELGEADYIASQLPRLEFDDMSTIFGILYECFTHHYINQLIKSFELIEETVSIASKENMTSLGLREWENIIVCLHEKITWDIQRDSEDKHFKTIIKQFYKAMSIIEDLKVDRIGNDYMKKLDAGYNEVIEIIKELGCNESIVVKSMEL